jgi:dATP/dGTP diphosphohydrolase
MTAPAPNPQTHCPHNRPWVSACPECEESDSKPNYMPTHCHHGRLYLSGCPDCERELLARHPPPESLHQSCDSCGLRKLDVVFYSKVNRMLCRACAEKIKTSEGRLVKQEEGMEASLAAPAPISLAAPAPITNTPSPAASSHTAPRYDLIPIEILNALARRFTLGATKYSRDSWKKGDAAFQHERARHLVEHLWGWFNGIPDEDTGTLAAQLDAVLWNAAVLVWFEAELKDRRTSFTPHTSHPAHPNVTPP